MNGSSRHIAICAAALLLTACAAGPDYEAPEVSAPERFVAQEVVETLNEGKEDIPVIDGWWNGFADPVLDALVQDGIENNYDIAAAAARVKAAQARIRLAGAGDEPVVEGDTDASLSEQVEIDNGDTETTRSVFATLDLTLPLDVFGRTQRRVESASAGLEGARADLRGVALATSSKIALEYLRLRGNQRQLELLRESVALQEKTLSIVKSRYEAGLSPELDLRRAETSVENLRADIPPLTESLVNSRNRLAVLTGLYPGAYEDALSEQGELPDYRGRIPDLLPLEVLAMRPDIREAESELKRAVAEIGVAQAEFYPAFELSGAISIGTRGVSGAPSLDVLIGTIGALIEQVFTDGGERRANVEIAKADAEEALAAYEQALRNGVREVEDALAAISSSMQRQESLQKSVESSTRSFYQAETLYQQGLISFLDVVDAQRVLASAEQQLAGEKTRFATRIATLFRVLGAPVDTES